MNTNNESVMFRPKSAKLTIDQLAEALYEGSPHLSNLAETLARQHSTGCLSFSFYSLMGEDVQNFWRGIAKQLINHSKEWRANQGCICILSEEESARLKDLPRVL